MFLKELVNLADYYVGKNTAYIMSWQEFKIFFRKNSKEILFSEKIIIRKGFYNKIFNTLQILYFFNKKLWSFTLIENDKKKYFGVHLRYQTKSVYHAKKYNERQNIKFAEAKELVSLLIKQHPDLKCIIFTDNAGMNQFKSLKKISSRIKFSRELSLSFLEDIKLLCQCQYYYAYKGGGMGVFPKFSNIKFCIAQEKLGNEFSWDIKNNQIASWNNIDQKFFVDKNISIDKYISSIKLYNSN